MAVRNEGLAQESGVNWIDGEILYAEDLNDTFDQIQDQLIITQKFKDSGNTLKVTRNMLTATHPVMEVSQTNSGNAQTALRVRQENTGAYSIDSTGTIRTNSMEFNFGGDSTGDIYYRNSSGTLSRLAVGSLNQVLTVFDGIPRWSSLVGAGTVNSASNRIGNSIPNQTANFLYNPGSSQSSLSFKGIKAGNGLSLTWSNDYVELELDSVIVSGEWVEVPIEPGRSFIRPIRMDASILPYKNNTSGLRMNNLGGGYENNVNTYWSSLFLSQNTFYLGTGRITLNNYEIDDNYFLIITNKKFNPGGGTPYRANIDLYGGIKFRPYLDPPAELATAGGLYYDSGSNVFKYHNGTEWLEIGSGGGSGGTPAGSNTLIQYNNNGSFGASSSFSYVEFTASGGYNDKSRLAVGSQGDWATKRDGYIGFGPSYSNQIYSVTVGTEANPTQSDLYIHGHEGIRFKLGKVNGGIIINDGDLSYGDVNNNIITIRPAVTNTVDLGATYSYFKDGYITNLKSTSLQLGAVTYTTMIKGGANLVFGHNIFYNEENNILRFKSLTSTDGTIIITSPLDNNTVNLSANVSTYWTLSGSNLSPSGLYNITPNGILSNIGSVTNPWFTIFAGALRVYNETFMSFETPEANKYNLRLKGLDGIKLEVHNADGGVLLGSNITTIRPIESRSNLIDLGADYAKFKDGYITNLKSTSLQLGIFSYTSLITGGANLIPSTFGYYNIFAGENFNKILDFKSLTSSDGTITITSFTNYLDLKANVNIPIHWVKVTSNPDYLMPNAIFRAYWSGTPSTLSAGMIWYNDSHKKFYGTDGTNIIDLGVQETAATPGGGNACVQFNNNGSFGGNFNFTFSEGSNSYGDYSQVSLGDGNLQTRNGYLQLGKSYSNMVYAIDSDDIYLHGRTGIRLKVAVSGGGVILDPNIITLRPENIEGCDLGASYSPFQDLYTRRIRFSRTETNSKWLFYPGTSDNRLYLRHDLTSGTTETFQFGLSNYGVNVNILNGTLNIKNGNVYGKLRVETSAPTSGDGSDGDIWFRY